MELPQERMETRPNGLELTRSQGFLDGERDIFDLLDASVETRNELRTISAGTKNHQQKLDHAINLLSRITSTLSRAQRHISEQNVRIENLEELATVDTLTGFLNRKGFDEAMQRELARIKRQKGAGGVLATIELENYDNLIRRHNAIIAQKAVFNAARLLNREIRDMDVAARISENEFVLMLVNTDTMQATQRLQEMALRLNRLSFNHKDAQNIRLHASISLKPYHSDDTFPSSGLSTKNEQYPENTEGMRM